MLNEEDRKLLEFSRKVILTYLKDGTKLKPLTEGSKSFFEKSGVFCTLKINDQLRGCIGYPEPIFPLIEALQKASISSATQDPRFPVVTLDELDEIVIELTILTPPKLVSVENPDDYLNEIIIGKHGLIAELEESRGLLLPQVPVEWNWTTIEFLEQTCNKAWLPKDAYKNPKFKLYKFEGKIISEKEL